MPTREAQRMPSRFAQPLSRVHSHPRPQMKELVAQHLRSCKDPACATCDKLRAHDGSFSQCQPAAAKTTRMDETPSLPSSDQCEDCAICCEQLGAVGPLWSCPTCRHTLHSGCWSRWAVANPTCVLCRSASSFRRYD